ncbi:Cellulase (glycosyl hydrolase family 5) [Aquisphaera giovannonii]|uniref:Cellulase (Glycosyl hydrolase family 5) n=1 Tax=Aquisphaera giovannonii TaxID=406548 RepID=A0A5B9W895_9BACT|nr:cellulase family glycosylhydrolase [Aquisphaera giovannonii]QEH36305.1 Cellulase (glycosyl hydrolase family 5) [Aquisphaera giovannonii]
MRAWAACIGLSISLMATPPDAAASGADPPPRLERIRVSVDGTRFVQAGSGRGFVPWGFNYLGLFEHLAEDDWQTPEGWKRIEADFREMKRLGANVVRWHLQFETFVKAADRVDEQQLGRLRRLLGVARENGLYLDLTGLNCFRRDRIPAWYDALAEADRWKCQAFFWEAVARTCAGEPAVFCYNLMNEPVIAEPKPDEPPWVTGELGGFFFVQRISNRPAGRDAKDIAEAWVKSLVAAIRRHDRETLVTVGDIAWTVIWPGGKPAFASQQVARHLDFVSVHLYPATGRIDRDVAALEPYDVGKPLVVEEIFPMGCSVADLDKFIDATTPRVDGWIAHYFGHTAAEHRAGAQPAGALVADFLDYWSRKGAKIQRR